MIKLILFKMSYPNYKQKRKRKILQIVKTILGIVGAIITILSFFLDHKLFKLRKEEQSNQTVSNKIQKFVDSSYIKRSNVSQFPSDNTITDVTINPIEICNSQSAGFYKDVSMRLSKNMPKYLAFPLWTEDFIFTNIEEFNKEVFARIDNSKKVNNKFDMNCFLLNVYTFDGIKSLHSINPGLMYFLNTLDRNFEQQILFAEVKVEVDANHSDSRVLIFNKSDWKIIGIMDI